MKKQNLKPLIFSALAAVAMAGIGAGATFALFTDKAETQIDVKAGKVEIKSEYEFLNAYSMDPTDNTKSVQRTQNQGFVTGGTFAFDNDTGVATLSNMVPGDGINFKVKFTNESNVAIKYRFYVKAANDNGLFDGLKVKFGDTELTETINAWQSLEQNAALPATELTDGTVSIELPKDAGNEYQGKTCQIIIGYEAVQGNAEVKDEIEIDDDAKTVVINSEFGWNEFAKDVDTGVSYAGYTVSLGRDLDFSEYRFEDVGETDDSAAFRGSFDGKNHKISNITKVYGDGEWFGLFPRAIGTVTFSNITLSKVNFKGYRGGALLGSGSNSISFNHVYVEDVVLEAVRQTGGIAGSFYGSGADNCGSKDVKITLTPAWNESASEYDDGDKVGGLFGFIQNDANADITNCVAENIEIKAYRDIGAIIGAYGVGQGYRNMEGFNHEILFKNNTVKGNIKLTADQQTNSYGSKAANIDDPSRTDEHIVGIGRYFGIGDTNHTWHGQTLNSVVENANYDADAYDVTVIPAN